MTCEGCFLVITLFIILYYYGVVALGLQATVTIVPSPQNITINFYSDNSVLIGVAGLNPLSEFTYEINLTTTSGDYLFIRYWSEDGETWINNTVGTARITSYTTPFPYRDHGAFILSLEDPIECVSIKTFYKGEEWANTTICFGRDRDTVQNGEKHPVVAMDNEESGKWARQAQLTLIPLVPVILELKRREHYNRMKRAC